MKKIRGMIAAVPTPFREDESINYDTYEQLLNYLIDNGMHWLLIGGSTGEYSLMSKDERKDIIKFACGISKGKIGIIAGCSCSRTCDTIEMVKYAESVGADAGLVLPPYYMKTSAEGIKDYYKEIAGSVEEMGIVIYHYPDATGVFLEPEFIMELAEIKNIVAVKNTAEMDHTAKLINMAKDKKFSIINGFETIIMGTLTSGGDGTMGIVHNMVPKKMVEIYEAIENNDVVKAKNINSQLLTLYSMMEEEPYPGPLKAALNMMGFDMGVPRKPIVPASDGMRERLRVEMNKLGIL